MDKLIKCGSCNYSFDPRAHRLFVFDALPKEEKMWPSPALENMHKEWWNYQSVKCPKCGNEFRTTKLKLLGIFSPIGLVIFSISFIVAIVLYFIFVVLNLSF